MRSDGSIDLEVLNRFSILYIEDDPDLRKHTASVLEDFSRCVHAVSNCREALSVIEREPVDVILADILLEEENGLECVKRIREISGEEIPVIMATAYTDTQFLLEAIRLHVRDYLVKPISLKELLQTLYWALLPKIKEREIQRSQNIIRLISLVCGGKQVELVRFIVEHLDDENRLHFSYSEISENTGISKPTVIKLFRQLLDLGILKKIQNAQYQLVVSKLDSL